MVNAAQRYAEFPDVWGVFHLTAPHQLVNVERPTTI